MIFPELKVRTLDRKRLSFDNGYYYLGRNMIQESHDKRIIKKLFKSFDVKKIQDYPDVEETISNLSNFLKAPRSNILLVQGIEGGIKALLDTYNLSGSKACIIEPTYKMYEVFCKCYNIDLIKLRNFSIEEIKKNIPKVSILFIDNPKCHLENYFRPDEIDELTKECRKYNVLLFLDEAYEGFGTESFIKHRPNFFEKKEYNNLILAGSFSKKYALPSIKSGFLIANQNTCSQLSASRLSYELNYFSCCSINFLINNFKYFDDFSRSVVEKRESLKDKFKGLKKIAASGSHTHTITISSNKLTIDKLFNCFKKNNLILGRINSNNLLMTASLNKKINKKISKSLNDFRSCK